MDASSSALHDKLGSLSKSEGAAARKEKDDINHKIIEACEAQVGEQLRQRCVIIQRDEKGYGLTVSGDNPVFVQSVKPDGAAAKAGVQQGDRIIKVNGTLVTHCNHQEVVKLIKSGSYVALMLLGKPLGQGGNRGNAGPPITLPAQHPSVVQGQGQGSKLSSSSERITGPQPVDPEKQIEVTITRIHTIKKMYEKEVVFLEKLQVEYNKNPSELLRQNIQSASKRVKTLEEQLITLTGLHPDVPRSPRSPPTLRQWNSEIYKSSSGNFPFLGKTLMHQTSAPVLPKTMDRSPSGPPPPPPPPSSSSTEEAWGSPPPPPSPLPAKGVRRDHGFPMSARQISVSTSLENISKHANNKATTWPHGGPTHSRQSSSPDSLLHNIENLQKNFVLEGKVQGFPEWSLNRSHSEVGSLHGPHPSHSEVGSLHGPHPRKYSASDAFSEVENSRKWNPLTLPTREFASDSPHGSPPNTPPATALHSPSLPGHNPATESLSPDHPHYIDSEGMDVDDYTGAEEVACLLEAPVGQTTPDVSTPGVIRTDACISSDRPLVLNTCSAIEQDAPLSASSSETKSSNSPSLHSPVFQQYGTPPEGQSSPTSSLTLHSSTRLGQNPFIICMEDDEISSDNEMCLHDDHGPFKSLWKLVKNHAHLAVFMHYLITNSNPASLFFYLICNIYECGTGKEMKKWAYEIHSSFLLPGAPMQNESIDESILAEIDDVLLNQIEKEDALKTLFHKARKKAQEDVNKLLADFRNKRTLGLSGFFGPPDLKLQEAVHDRNKQLKIIEDVLLSTFESIAEDFENASDKNSVLASSLATILKQFGVKNPQALSLIDRCPTFVAKERSRLRFLQRTKKSIVVLNHQFVPQHYHSTTFCTHCQVIIWGIGHQGYQCQHCEINIHKHCVKTVEETCFGPVRSKKDKRKDRMSGIMENIIGKSRKPSHPNVAAIDRAKKLHEDGQNIDSNSVSPSNDVPDKVGRTGKFRDRPDCDDHMGLHMGNTPGSIDHLERIMDTKKGSSIGRSESFRQRRENRPSFRKRSDPNIPRSKSDVEVDEKSNLDNSGSSSNSSLSARSLDSPSNSQEMVHRTPSSLATDSLSSCGSTLTSSPSVASAYNATCSTPGLPPCDDSDLEAEADPPNWQDSVDWEVLRLMKPKEKKRQDVINELFHTERTHVRNLKLLERIFYQPMLQGDLLPADLLQALFPNLAELLELHSGFNSKMKEKRKEENVIGNIGELMLQLLDGQSGDYLMQAVAIFCRHQSSALENLKNRQRKDQKLAQFLAEAEANNMCRRLQLKDIIASGVQRLTKYPLLLENVAKYTKANSEEHSNLLKAVDCSKHILAHVNQAVKEAENFHRLSDLQKRIDKSAFDKADHIHTQAFKDVVQNLDLTEHKLLHEGPLTWKLNKHKSIEVHVVLLEEILLLLHKQDDKFLLKFQSINFTSGKEESKQPRSPILRVRNLYPRHNASDNRGFFLVTTHDQHAIYEFSAATRTERNTWVRNLTDASEAFKNQNGQTKNQEPERAESTEDPNEEIESSVKDSLTEVPTENPENQPLREMELAENSHQESSDESPAVNNNTKGKVVSEENSLHSPAVLTSSGVALSPSKEDEDQQQYPTQRRQQRVECMQIADGPQLIDPQEVVVQPGAILQLAEPVLTPIEQLKRKDQLISTALMEKEELVAKILQVPKEEFDHITERMEESDNEKDTKELVLAAIHQVNRLCRLLNETFRVTEEDTISATSLDEVTSSGTMSPSTNSTGGSSSSTLLQEGNLFPGGPSPMPSPKAGRKSGCFLGPPSSSLLNISSSLNKHLSQLLCVVTAREEERKQLRKELHSSREQIHLMHETHRHCSVRSRSPSNQSLPVSSRPSSFLSVSSSSEGGGNGGTSSGVCDSGEHDFRSHQEAVNHALFSDQFQLSAPGDYTVLQPVEDQGNFVGMTEMFVDTSYSHPSQPINDHLSQVSANSHQTTDLDSEGDLVRAKQSSEVEGLPAEILCAKEGQELEETTALLPPPPPPPPVATCEGAVNPIYF